MRTNYYVEQFFHGECRLPVVPVSDELNPFAEDGVHLHAVLGYTMPYDSMKFLAVLGLGLDAKERGLIDPETTIIEATSGATGLGLTEVMPAQPFNVRKVILVMNEDVPLGKKAAPYFAGATIIPPLEGMSGIATARKLGGGGWKPEGEWQIADDGTLNLDQYSNPANTRFYREWAAMKIIKQLPSADNLVLVAPVGTGGTIVGLGQGFRERAEKVTVVGAMCAPGEEIPGVRDLAKMKEITLPWKEALDDRIEVEARPSYLSSLWFHWTTGLTPGLSGGFTYAAALKFFHKRKDEGTLDELRGKDGAIHAAIIFHDGWRPYLVDRFPMLPTDYQKPSSAPKPWQLLW